MVFAKDKHRRLISSPFLLIFVNPGSRFNPGVSFITIRWYLHLRVVLNTQVKVYSWAYTILNTRFWTNWILYARHKSLRCESNPQCGTVDLRSYEVTTADLVSNITNICIGGFRCALLLGDDVTILGVQVSDHRIKYGTSQSLRFLKMRRRASVLVLPKLFSSVVKLAHRALF